MNHRITVIVILVVFVLIAGWFFFVRDSGPRAISNPPTAEEIKRMDEIEQSRTQTDPNAKSGVGVKPVGSIPPTPEPETSTSTTASSTTELSIPLEAGSNGTVGSNGTSTDSVE